MKAAPFTHKIPLYLVFLVLPLVGCGFFEWLRTPEGQQAAAEAGEQALGAAGTALSGNWAGAIPGAIAAIAGLVGAYMRRKQDVET